MRMSSRDQQKLSELYEKTLIKEMESADVLGGSGDNELKLDNEDDYAEGDTRIPYVVGRIQSRQSKITPKTKKKSKRKSLSFLN